ncbi:hypothetical protein [Deinococcus pimensis]|uniref:hypothetical protein n=1 Tax=Deinococcus pimensis TaxID=309888 RepID=UPI0004BBDF26|nr:hypothetical protein [Deinococcus pimensis]
MRPGSSDRHAHDLLLLFERPRAELRRLAHSPEFLALVEREEPPSVRELIVLAFRHVDSADVLPFSFLVEELQEMLHAARGGERAGTSNVNRLRQGKPT